MIKLPTDEFNSLLWSVEPSDGMAHLDVILSTFLVAMAEIADRDT